MEDDKALYIFAKKRIIFKKIINDKIEYENGKAIKADEFVKVTNITQFNEYRKCFNIEGFDGLFIRDFYQDSYLVFNTLEEVLAHQAKELAKDKSKYVLKNSDGTLFKDKKYKALKDIFPAVMAEWGYYSYFENQLTKENIAKNPELKSINEFPYWMGSYNTRPLEELKTLEVHKYLGAKLPTEKVEYDLYSKVTRNFNNLYIALEYGLCVKELYSKMDENTEKEFQYVLVYTPKDYINYENFTKEDISIKNNIKVVKKGNFIKATKYGKTAIAFKNLGDILPFYRSFTDDEIRRIKMITLDGREIVCESDAKVEIRRKIIQNAIDLD